MLAYLCKNKDKAPGARNEGAKGRRSNGQWELVCTGPGRQACEREHYVSPVGEGALKGTSGYLVRQREKMRHQKPQRIRGSGARGQELLGITPWWKLYLLQFPRDLTL